jgi:hypothetical protein
MTPSDRISMIVRRILVAAAVAVLCFVFAKASQAEAVCTLGPATHVLRLGDVEHVHLH